MSAPRASVTEVRGNTRVAANSAAEREERQEGKRGRGGRTDEKLAKEEEKLAKKGRW